MPQFQNQEELISHMRSTYPGIYSEMSDEDIYSEVNKMAQDRGQILPEYKPAPIYTPTNETISTEEDKSSPSFIDQLYDAGEKIALGGAAELFTEKGFMGLPPEFFQKSYMESNAGHLNTAITGEEKYDVSEYKHETLAQEAGAFLLGMLSPVEVSLIVSGGKLGVMGAKLGVGTTSLLKKYGMNALGYNATKGLGKTSSTFVSSALSGGIGLGTFGAAHSAFADAAYQRMSERDEQGKGVAQVDAKKVVDAGSEGFLNSFVLGAPMGLIGRGFLGNYYAKHKLSEKPLTSLSRIATGAPGQLTSEIAAFSAIPNVYKELGMEAYQDFPDMPQNWLDFNDPWWRNAGFNAAIVTPMFGMNKAFSARNKLKESSKLIDEAMKIESEVAEKQVKANENLKSNLGISVTEDMMRDMSTSVEYFNNVKMERTTFNNNVKKIYEIIDRTDGDLSKATKKETIFLQKEGAETFLDLEGGLIALKNDANLLRSALDAVAKREGKTLKESDYLLAETTNNSNIDLLQGYFKEVNKNLTNVNRDVSTPVEEPAPTIVTPGAAKVVSLIKSFPQQGGAPKIDRVEVLEGSKEYLDFIKKGYGLEKGGKPKPISDLELSEEAKPFRIKIDEVGQGDKVKYKSLSELDSASKDALAEALRLRRIETNNTLSIVNQLLKFSNKRDLQSLTSSDTINFLKDKLKKQIAAGRADYIAPNATTNLNQISQLLRDIGFIEKPFSSPVLLKPYKFVTGQTKGLEEAGKIPGATAENVAKAVDNIKFGKSPVKFNTNEKVALELADYYQLRDRELNQLRVKDFDTSTNTLDLRATTGVGKADAIDRFIYLQDTSIINALKKLTKGKKENQKIFPKVSEKITKALQAEIKKVPKAEYKKATAKAIRKMGETLQEASNLNKIEREIWQQTTGHDLGVAVSNRIKTIYQNLGSTTRNAKAAEWQKIVLDKVFRNGTKSITKEMIKETKIERSQETPKFQKKAEEVPSSARELDNFIRQEIKNNPGVEARIIKDVDYAGRFYKGVIDVVEGKANMRTWYHENAHRLKNMIDATNNKELKALWKQAEKLFKKESKGRDLEEFIADELADWAIGRKQATTVPAKMKSWAGRLWTKIKQVFFGKSNLNKNDVRRILGEKIYKGFSTSKVASGQSIQMYQFATNAERAKHVKGNFTFAVKEAGQALSASDKKILINYIAENAKVSEPAKFKLGDGKMSESDIVAFNNVLETIPFKKLLKLADIGRRIEGIQAAENIEKGAVNINDRSVILKAMGIKDGNLYSATFRQLGMYQSYLMKLKFPGQPDNIAYLNEMKIQTLDKIPKDFKDATGLKRKAMLLFMPTHEVVGALGLKDLQSKLLRHATIETRLQGEFTEGFEAAAQKIIGGRWEGVLGKGVRDNLFLADNQRYIERLNTNDLSASNKSFAKKAFASDFAVLKDGKYILNKKYKKNPKEGLNLDTKEGKVVKEWMEYTERIEAELKEAARANFKTEAEYKEYLDNGDIGWIRGNAYVPRMPTKEFLRQFPQHGGKYHQDLLQKTANRIAKEMALKEHGPGVTAEQIMEKIPDAMKVAESAVQDIYTFSEKKSSTRFVKARSEKLPEYINIDGKRIKVYETSYESTVKAYGLGMSKFIANLEIFPEMTKLKHLNKAGNKADGNVESLLGAMNGNREWGGWLREQVEHQLGMVETSKGIGNDIGRGMDYGATIFAKTALGFPTSGGKNFILGQSMNMQTYYLRDYIRGIVKATGSDFKKFVRLSGATELGLRDIKTVKTQKIWDAIFKLGLMKPTENANRYIAIATSKYEQARLIRTISNPNSPPRKVKKALNRLKDFYFLNDKQIKILKKYGEHGVTEHSFANSFEKGKIVRELKNIEQQLNTYAHINTQGAAMHLFQPSWASGRITKPLLLFKRMAYAASDNQIRNVKLAVKNGDYMKLGMMTLAPVASGTAIVSMYSAMLGTPMPAENSNWFEWVKQMTVRGEVFGLGTDILRLLEGESAEYTIYPSLLNWGFTWIDLLKAPMEGRKTWDQSGKDFLKKTSSGYRAYININKRKGEKNKMYRIKLKGNTLFREFKKESLPELTSPKINYEQQSPHYRDFREVFYGGTPEEAAKQYVVSLFALATDIFRQKRFEDGKTMYSIEEALESAVSRFEREITKLNPNPISFVDDLSKEKEKMSGQWLAWLNKDGERGKAYMSELATGESMYKSKLMAIRELIDNPKYVIDKEIAKSIKKSLRRAGFTVK
tara:strand:- start:40 stop:6735 length:6696 start_codon:yes stop_codon:yes gene_type:complete